MSTLQKIIDNKKFCSSLATLLLSFVFLVSVLIATLQVNAWFVSHKQYQTPSVVSSYLDSVTYSLDNGKTWNNYESGSAIELQLTENGQLTQEVKIKVKHKGQSAACVRVHTRGSFKNRHTGTYLPHNNAVAVWKFDVADDHAWVADASSSYIYYADKIYLHNPLVELTNLPQESNLETFSVTFNKDSIPTDISQYQDYKVELYIAVEAVQPDRMSAIWGVDAIPTVVTTG